MAICTVITQVRYVCSTCSTCSSFKDGHIDWGNRRDCLTCGGQFQWEPCTVAVLYDGDPRDWDMLISKPDWSRSLAYP